MRLQTTIIVENCICLKDQNSALRYGFVSVKTVFICESDHHFLHVTLYGHVTTLPFSPCDLIWSCDYVTIFSM